MAQRDAELLKVVLGYIRQDERVDLIFAERGLVLAKAQTPQPLPDDHRHVANTPLPKRVGSSSRADKSRASPPEDRFDSHD